MSCLFEFLNIGSMEPKVVPSLYSADHIATLHNVDKILVNEATSS
jgi:hypothetical protein